MMSEIAPRTRRRALRGRMENLSKTYLIAITSDALAPLSPWHLFQRLAVGALVTSGLSLSTLVMAIRHRSQLLRLLRSAKVFRPRLSLLGLCLALLAVLKRKQWRLYERLLLFFRPLMYRMVRPLLRLSSWSVHRAAKELSPKSALVASDAEQGANDGLIDTVAQRCLDCPRLARQQQPGGRQNRSALHVPQARFHALARAYSAEHVDREQAEEQPLQRGRWHELHVPNSDHSLGTWFDCHHSEKMYDHLFSILRRRMH